MGEEKRGGGKKIKPRYIIIGSIVLFIAAAMLTLHFVVNHLVRQALDELPAKLYDGFYDIRYEKAGVNLFTGKAYIENITVSSRSMDSIPEDVPLAIEGGIGSVVVKGWTVWEILFSKNIYVGYAGLQDPQFTIRTNDAYVPEKKKDKEKGNPFGKRRVFLEKILLNNPKVVVEGLSRDQEYSFDQLTYSLSRKLLSVKNFHLKWQDTTSSADSLDVLLPQADFYNLELSSKLSLRTLSTTHIHLFSPEITYYKQSETAADTSSNADTTGAGDSTKMATGNLLGSIPPHLFSSLRIDRMYVSVVTPDDKLLLYGDSAWVAMQGIAFYGYKTGWAKNGSELYNSASLSKLELHQINWDSLSAGQELYVDSIRVGGISAVLYPEESAKQTEAPTSGGLTLDMLPFPVSCRRIDFENINMRMPYRKGKTGVDLRDLKVSLRSLVLIPGRAPQLAGGSVSAGKFDLRMSDGFYGVKFDSCMLSLDSEMLSIHQPAFYPTYGKFEFGRALGFQMDRIQLHGPKIVINGIHWKDFLETNELYIDSFIANDLQFLLFRDMRIKENKGLHFPMPQQVFRMLPIQYHLGVAQVKRGRIAYEEFSATNNASSHVSFENITSHFRGITNIRRLNPVMKGDFFAYLMGKGYTEVYIQMPIFDPKTRYTMQGKMGDWDIRPLNKMLEIASGITILSGRINSASVQVTADSTSSQIKMVMLYENLKVKVNKKATIGKGNEENGFLSSLANTFILDNNPTKGKNPRVVETNADRVMYRFVVNHWWLTIFEGMKKSMLPGVAPSKDFKGINTKTKKSK